jgi:hypothetical protein
VNLFLGLAYIGTMVLLALVAMRPFNRPWHRARELVLTWASVVGAAGISTMWRGLEPSQTMGFGLSIALVVSLLARGVAPDGASQPRWHRAGTPAQGRIRWIELLTAGAASGLWLILALSGDSGSLPKIIGWLLTFSSYGALALETIRYRWRAEARGAPDGRSPNDR